VRRNKKSRKNQLGIWGGLYFKHLYEALRRLDLFSGKKRKCPTGYSYWDCNIFIVL
jgi:hypothetical protein